MITNLSELRQKTLPHCLEMHYPINLVIFMLGTNDTRIDYGFNASVEDITNGMRALIHIAKQSHYGKLTLISNCCCSKNSSIR